MKTKTLFTTYLPLRVALVVLMLATVIGASAATQYATNGIVWDNGITAGWASASGGARTAVWTAGNDAVFETLTGTVNNSNATAHNITFTVNTFVITNNTITLTGLTPTITCNNSGYADTIGSVIAGSAGLTMAGPGTLTFSGANTYTGPAILSLSARVVPAVVGAFGTNSVTVGSGSQVTVNTVSLTNNFTISGTGWTKDSTTSSLRLGALRIYNNFTVSGAVTLAAAATIRANGLAGTVGTVSGVIGDGGSGYALDTGSFLATSTLVLSGANTYSGATTISGGSLWLNHQLALQNSTLTMTGLGTLLFSNGVAANPPKVNALPATPLLNNRVPRPVIVNVLFCNANGLFNQSEPPEIVVAPL